VAGADAGGVLDVLERRRQPPGHAGLEQRLLGDPLDPRAREAIELSHRPRAALSAPP
jgi:hypothetical protein